jgi:superfamily II DNA or RNA helicase
MYEPRKYQQKAINNLVKSFDNVIRQNFTGTGKSLEIFYVAKYYVDQGKQVFIICPKDYLVESFYKTFEKEYPGQVSFVSANKKTNLEKPIILCTIQTLYRRKEKLETIPKLCLFDECHNLKASTFEEVVKFYKDKSVRILGWSATPVRLDGKGFDNLFDRILPGGDYRWYIDNNYLAPYEIPPINSYTMRLDMKMGDFDLQQQEDYLKKPKINKEIVENWLKYSKGKKTIVFCTSIHHAQKIEAEYNKLGQKIYGREIAKSLATKRYVNNEIISVPKKARENILQQFREDPKFLILTNVNIISEGLDIPDVECVQWLRLTASEVLCDQGNGRGNRYKPGKTQIILDHVGMIGYHGLPCRYRFYTLKGKEGKNYKWNCEQCGSTIKKDIRKLNRSVPHIEECSECGFFNCLPAKEPDKDSPYSPGTNTKTYIPEKIRAEGFLDLNNKKDINLYFFYEKYSKHKKFRHMLAALPNLLFTDYQKVAKLAKWSAQETEINYSLRRIYNA